MKPKSVNYKAIVIGIVIIYVFIILSLLSAGSAALGNPHTTVMKEIGNGIPRILEHGPKALFPYNPECSKLIGMVTLFTVLLGTYYMVQQKNKERDVTGNEQGSAGWNLKIDDYNQRYTFPYGSKDKNYEDNAILTNDVFLGLDGRKTQRNLNTLVIGGSVRLVCGW